MPLLLLLLVNLFTRFVLIPMASPVPDSIGLQQNGQLSGCPTNNNCVSSSTSMADLVHYTIPMNFDGSVEDARQQVTQLLRSYPLVTVLTSEGNYIHAEFRTMFWGFIDDLELYFNQSSGLIYVRSASRLGGNDFGLNRQRVENLRRDLADEFGWTQQ
jgi:uncharacterized protein (DUF1499 family)